MIFTIRRAALIVAAALFAAVLSQVFYITVVSNAEGETLRRITWMTEMALFTIPATVGIVLAAKDRAHPLAWAAIAVGGMVNLIQVAMGLAMFGPAREAADAAVFQTVLQGAFFLYFHGKAMFGLAAIGFGIGALRGGAVAKGLGIAGILSGGAAAILCLLGMADGMAWVQPAGAAGTLATALLALLIVFTGRGQAE